MKNLIILVCLICFFVTIGKSQYYTTHIPVESRLILPPDYNPAISYPVVVMLPFTGGDAEYMFNAYAQTANADGKSYKEKLGHILTVFNAERPEKPRSFIVLLPKGKGSRRDHSWKGFKACFERYERRIIQDLNKFAKRYNLNLDKVYLTGVSLGGDLAWALSQRNPKIFQGAMVMGSRCSYPPESNTIQTMLDKDYAFFMTMGMQEAWDRLAGMRHARKILDSTGVQYVYKEMPDLQHNKAPLWLFLEGMDYLVFNENRANTIQERQVPNLVSDLVGIYDGDVELNSFDINKESEDLMEEGNGLFSPVFTEFVEAKKIIVEQKTNSRVSFKLQLNNLPAIEAYVSKGLDKATGEAIIQMTIPEQKIGNYKYRGTSIGLDDTKVHGILTKEHFSLSFDCYKSSQQKKYTTYSFFSIL